MNGIIRVFPRRTSGTPDDAGAFVGPPPFPEMRPAARDVRGIHISQTFTWDARLANALRLQWRHVYPGKSVCIDGPAVNHRGGEFTPGMYLKPGYTITSRGCPRQCKCCLVPGREGGIRLLRIKPGHNVLDNNLLACGRPHIEAVLDMLDRQDHAVKFTGGLEAILVQKWFVERLMRLRLETAFLAYDRPAQKPHVERAVRMILDAADWTKWQTRKKLQCYCLFGYEGDTADAAVERFEWIKGLGVTPYAMLYQPPLDEKPRKGEQMKRRLRKWMRPSSVWAKEANDKDGNDEAAQGGLFGDDPDMTEVEA